MANVCKICGNRLDEKDNYCVICNKYVEAIDESRYVEHKEESVFAVYNKKADIIVEKKKSGFIKFLIFAIIGIAIIVGAYSYFATYAKKTYIGAIDDYYTGLFEDKHSRYIDSLLPDEIKKYEIEKELYYSGIQTDKINGIEYKYEVLGSNKAIKERREKMEGVINTDLGVQLILEDAYFIDVKVVKSGAETGTESIDAWAVKVDGKWYAYIR